MRPDITQSAKTRKQRRDSRHRQGVQDRAHRIEDRRDRRRHESAAPAALTHEVCRYCAKQLPEGEAAQREDCWVINSEHHMCAFHHQEGAIVNRLRWEQERNLRPEQKKPKQEVTTATVPKESVVVQTDGNGHQPSPPLQPTVTVASAPPAPRPTPQREVSPTPKGISVAPNAPGRLTLRAGSRPSSPRPSPGVVARDHRPASSPSVKPEVALPAQGSADAPETRPTDQGVTDALEALQSLEIPVLYGDEGKKVASLPVVRIIRNIFQPRTEFDAADLREFGQRLKAVQIQPIIVTPIKDDPDHDYMLVDGERRWRAAQAAGLEHLWAIVVVIDDPKVLFKTSLLANEDREQLSVMDQARAFRRAIDEKIMTIAEIADWFKKSTGWVGHQLMLLKLHPDIQARLGHFVPRDRRLPTSVAVRLASIPDQELQLKLADEIQGKGMKHTKANALVNRAITANRFERTGRRHKPSDDLKNVERFLRVIADRTDILLDMHSHELERAFASKTPVEVARIIEDVTRCIDELDSFRTSLVRILKQRSNK